MKELKTGAYANQNLAWSSRRIANSSVILYKAQNKPWDESSVRPYLGRANLGALRKTMPFLLRSEEQERRLDLLTEQAERKAQIQEILNGRETEKEYGQKNAAVAALRAEQVAAEKQMEDLEALFSKKQLMSINFFHRINMAFDLQKIKMFDYYRTIRMQRALKAENAAARRMLRGSGTKRKTQKPRKLRVKKDAGDDRGFLSGCDPCHRRCGREGLRRREAVCHAPGTGSAESRFRPSVSCGKNRSGLWP
jgi:hypothetical protein